VDWNEEKKRERVRGVKVQRKKRVVETQISRVFVMAIAPGAMERGGEKIKLDGGPP